MYMYSLEILSEDLGTFQCIFHSLKNLIDVAQKQKDASQDDYAVLSQAVLEEKEKRSVAIEKCKKFISISIESNTRW
jgi:bacterioferritin (cytochrome b1)